MTDSGSKQLSVLLVVQDAMDREPLTRLVPSGWHVTVVHSELEAATLAYKETIPDAILFAINELDASADLYAALLKRANVQGNAAPYGVALCLQRHSPRALELCVSGSFDDYATAKPTPQVECIHLALHRAMLRKESHREIEQFKRRLDAVQATFEALGRIRRDALGKRQAIKANAAGDPTLAALFDEVASGIGKLMAQGLSACGTQTKKILIVDDDELMREVLGATLESGGFESCLAANANEAFTQLGQTEFCLILMDLMMPGLDGIGATRKIRSIAQCRATPIIIISGEGDLESVKMSRAAGATDFLIKPIDRDRLLEKVAKYAQ
ncbi:MAG: response regulator [Burkholderiales bacterium]